VDGVAYPASPSTNTVPVVTSANTVTYEAVPNAALANPSLTVAGHSIALGGTQAIACGDLSNGAAGCSAPFGTATNQIAEGGVITAGGPTGSATVVPIITYNAAGQLTAVSSATATPAVGSVTGLGTGVATALGGSVGSAGAFVVNGGAGGTPSSINLANATGIPAATSSVIGGVKPDGTTITVSAGVLTATASGMVYPGAGIPSSTGSAWGASYSLQGNGAKVQLSTGSTTSGHCVQYDASGNVIDSGSPCSGGVVRQYAVFQEQYASGTAGATLSSAAFNTRALNTTVINTITGATLSSNEVSLPAGTYHVVAHAITAAGGNQVSVYDFTHSVFLVNGITIYGVHTGTGLDGGNVDSIADGYFTLSSTSSIGIYDWVGPGTSGGLAISSGEPEVYAQLIINAP
jgi:hypothetical protein